MGNRNNVNRSVLIGSTLIASWLGMQTVHELGHVLGAWATGAKVTRVVLHPLAISRTDVAGNHSPGVVVWAGPVVGAALPVAAWLLAARLKRSWAYLLQFFAGFCLIANGLYIGVGSFGGVGDCGEMLRHGARMWQLWAFGLTGVLAGVWLWHGLGTQFGLGKNAEQVSKSSAAWSLLVCLGLVIAELVWGG